MVKYTCDKCLKIFNQKSHYTRHLNRKRPCKIDNERLKLIIGKGIDEKDKIGRKIKYIDLFSGIGSFHYSFDKLGFECIMASDIYKAAKETYQQNYNIEPMDDIRNIDPNILPNYDILCAGFPCQPFSQAGLRKGFDDVRGNLFDEIMRFVKINKPKMLILENVAGLLKHDKNKTFEIICNKIEEENYDLKYKILKCSDYGIPQMRKRLFIICIKKELKKNIDNFFDLDEYKKEITLSEYLNKNFSKKTAYTIRCGGRSSPIDDRHNWDGYWVDGKEYRLTIEDGLKLQGFENFNLSGSVTQQWKMLGNTIPTIFTKIIGERIKKLNLIDL